MDRQTGTVTLGVNIDHVATVRQARRTRYPQPVDAALIAERAGADAITVHLREDRRHIQDRDVALLRELLHIRLNLEMAVTEEMVDIALRVRPADCCFVPERRAELTTEGGLDVVTHRERIADACGRLQDEGIRVSLFIDPEPAQVDAAVAAGAGVIELHTGNYADAVDEAGRTTELQRLRAAAEHAHAASLQVNAGHGLNYWNVAPVAAMAPVRELNIGHAIVARALLTGMAEAVCEMKRLLRQARP